MRLPPVAFLLLISGSVLAAEPTPEQIRFFESRIRPLFRQHCFKCHGPEKQQGGLRLDSRETLLKGGDSGAAAVPGKPRDSLVVRAVNHDGLKMPPKLKLRPDEIAALTEWVQAGLPWPETATVSRRPGVITNEDRRWWAFQPLATPSLPTVNDVAWPRNGLDHFILARLEQRGLVPVEAVDRRAFLRRVTFDLTGLPPTPEEVRAFAEDTTPQAAEKVVDRLLASSAYGERWGRHWLDVVRYADTAGDNSDYPVPLNYRYRNWVIDAVNADKPYDVFLREQIAGDLMPGATEKETRERLIATGYLANARRFGSYEDTRYQWYLTFEDTIENLGRAVLGLNLSCARCHDHKFDPIPSEDYYALYGFFQSTRYPWPGIELDKAPRDLVPLAPSQQIAAILKDRQERLNQFDARIKLLEKEKKTSELQAVRKERDRLAKTPLAVEMAYAVAEGNRWVGNAKLQLQGDPLKPGKEVSRRFLTILGGQLLPSDVPGSGRLQLAHWLTDPQNPLTARVLVNRLWMHHFGKGIVPTPSDFGRQGKPPTHPELLDWLARHFLDSGWSLKAMHRLMVLSATYQSSSREDEANRRIDPGNALLWRYSRRRLDAEAIRDSLLTLGGNLDRSNGGPHPFPEQSTWNFTQHNPFKAEYETSRRSVYLMTQRIQRHSFLALFDGPDTNASTAQRGSSTTTLQALYLLNNPFARDQARLFAVRLMHERSSEPERIERAFLLSFGRPVSTEERAASVEYLRRGREKASGAGLPAAQGEILAWESLARVFLMSNEFVYID